MFGTTGESSTALHISKESTDLSRCSDFHRTDGKLPFLLSYVLDFSGILGGGIQPSLPSLCIGDNPVPALP